MSTIELSAGWLAAMTPRMLCKDTPGGSNHPASKLGLLNAGNAVNNANISCGRLYLMKGAVPTAFSQINTLGARIADALCLFSSGYGHPGDFVGTNDLVNPVSISSIYKNALASGEATWFWWVVAKQLASGEANPAVALDHNAYGTVGVIGSGSDLEMSNTNLVQGEPYRLRNLRLQFPTTWSY